MNGDNIKLLDPEKLRRFIDSLEITTVKLNDALNKIDLSTKSLGSHYRDSQYIQLRKQVLAATTQLNEFIELSKKTSPSLEEKLAKVKQYENLEGRL